MTLRSFKNGIHPSNDGKALTKDCAIRRVTPAGEAVYPLNQHIGAPAQPCVAVGDSVLVGQAIAQPGGFVSAAICTAVSGTVKAIDNRTGLNGRAALSIVIDNDGAYTPVPTLGQPRDPANLSAEDILGIIRDAGIVGQGGAGFPTHVKLSMKPGVQPDTVIINAAECEPYLTSDYRLLMEQTAEFVQGVRILLQLFPQARAVVGIEDNKPAAISLLRKALAEEARIAIQPLKTKYPQGGERMLIHAVTGRDINSRHLPIDAGCVVVNVSTVWSIYQAVCRQIPQITTIMTITGDAAATPCNLAVPVGISCRQVLEAGGGLQGEAEKIIAGGPMMGLALASLDVPTQKTTSALLCMTTDEVAIQEPTPCIRCGRCVGACPSGLVPATLVQASDAHDLPTFEALGGMECMECGSCTYVCPARRRLTQSFRTARAAVAANRKKKG